MRTTYRTALGALAAAVVMSMLLTGSAAAALEPPEFTTVAGKFEGKSGRVTFIGRIGEWQYTKATITGEFESKRVLKNITIKLKEGLNGCNNAPGEELVWSGLKAELGIGKYTSGGKSVETVALEFQPGNQHHAKDRVALGPECEGSHWGKGNTYSGDFALPIEAIGFSKKEFALTARIVGEKEQVEKFKFYSGGDNGKEERVQPIQIGQFFTCSIIFGNEFCSYKEEGTELYKHQAFETSEFQFTTENKTELIQ